MVSIIMQALRAYVPIYGRFAGIGGTHLREFIEKSDLSDEAAHERFGRSASARGHRPTSSIKVVKNLLAEQGLSDEEIQARIFKVTELFRLVLVDQHPLDCAILYHTDFLDMPRLAEVVLLMNKANEASDTMPASAKPSIPSEW